MPSHLGGLVREKHCWNIMTMRFCLVGVAQGLRFQVCCCARAASSAVSYRGCCPCSGGAAPAPLTPSAPSSALAPAPAPGTRSGYLFVRSGSAPLSSSSLTIPS
eukprot:3938569-Rhodomonas_salina.1